MKRLWRRWSIRVSLAFLGVLLLALGWHLGWLAEPTGRRDATGWAAIAPDDLPAATGASARGLADSADASPVPASEPEIHWLGHSGFLVRWEGQTVLIDPNTSLWCTISKRVLAPRIDLGRVGAVDAVLISHAHFDHLDLPTLRSIESIGTVVVPLGTEEFVSLGEPVPAMVALRPGEVARIGPLEVIAVAAAHNGGRLHPLKSRRLAVGYVIRSSSSSIYYSGDTGASNSFEEVRRLYHPRLAILPIGGFLPRIPLRYYHLSPEEAVAAAVRLGVDTVIPCHFGTFTLSLDRPNWALPRFAAEAGRQGVAWRMPSLLGEASTPGAKLERWSAQ